MQIELTIQVNLPDVIMIEQDGKMLYIDRSEQDIVNAVADLDYDFVYRGEKLLAVIIDVSANDQTLWSA